MTPRRFFTGVLLVTYPVAVHTALLVGQPQWASLMALLLCISLTLLLGLGRITSAAASVLLIACILAVIGVLSQSKLLVVLIPFLVNVALCVLFGRTLVGDREALITRFARLDEDQVPPDLVRYTHTLTFIWCLFFAVLAMEVALLAFFASAETWSLYANFLNYLFVVALFILEYVYRRWRFRDRPHKSPLEFLASLAKADWVALSLR